MCIRDRFNFDDNSLYRLPEIVAYRDLDEEDPNEIEASKFGLAYISLDGNIGCLVNGAGLATVSYTHLDVYKRQILCRVALECRPRRVRFPARVHAKKRRYR